MSVCTVKCLKFIFVICIQVWYFDHIAICFSWIFLSIRYSIFLLKFYILTQNWTWKRWKTFEIFGCDSNWNLEKMDGLDKKCRFVIVCLPFLKSSNARTRIPFHMTHILIPENATLAVTLFLSSESISISAFSWIQKCCAFVFIRVIKPLRSFLFSST